MNTFENKFVHFGINLEDSLITSTWSSNTADMEVEEWKNINLELVRNFETYQVSRFLIDTES